MRTITDAQQAVLDAGVQADHVRFSVKDSGGTWRDLTTWPGFNAVKHLSWRGAINDPCKTFDAVLARELYALSFSPFMENSALNCGFDPGAGFEPLLALNREVKIEVAVVPMDTQPASGDWVEFFRGRIDQFDAARGADITLSGRDGAGRLARQYIKKERVYAFASVGGAMVSLRIWAPELPVFANEYVLPATRGETDVGFAKFYQYDADGTTGTEEPAWTGGAGIVDGDTTCHYAGTPDLGGFPVQDVIQKILDDNKGIDPAVTLEVADDPLWDVTEFMQQRGFTLDAVRALATQIGFDLREKYNEGAAEWQLTLYEPERDAPTVLHTFSTADYREPKKLADDIAQRRNSVLVIFKDKNDTWPDGTPKRKEVTSIDPDSVDELEQELWSELQEDENGNIDTETEAQRLADSFVSDCSTPTADVEIPLTRAFPWVELNDFYTFVADNVRVSSDLSLAVTSWEHTFQGGRLETQLQLRGKPSIGHVVHLEKEYHPGKPPKHSTHRLEHFQAGTGAKVDFHAIVGGFEVKVNAGTSKNSLITEYEIHVSTDPDFTPDDTTLISVMTGNQMNMAYQVPGADYYATAVPRWYNAGQLVRGQPCTKKLITAGRGGAGHLEQYVEWGRTPLNGGFETWNDIATLPDHWRTQQTWGTNFERVTGAGGVSGDSWLRFNVQVLGIANIFTNQFTVEKTVSYDLSWWANITDAGTLGSVSLGVNWFDHNGDFLNTDVVDLIAYDQADMTEGTWYRRGGVVTAPEDARFACVILKQATNGNMVLDVDSVRFDRA